MDSPSNKAKVLHFVVPKLEVTEGEDNMPREQIVHEQVMVPISPKKLNRLEAIMCGSRERMPNSTIGFDSNQGDSLNGNDSLHGKDGDKKKSMLNFEHFGTQDKSVNLKSEDSKTVRNIPLSSDSTVILSQGVSSPQNKQNTSPQVPNKRKLEDSRPAERASTPTPNNNVNNKDKMVDIDTNSKMTSSSAVSTKKFKSGMVRTIPRKHVPNTNSRPPSRQGNEDTTVTTEKPSTKSSTSSAPPEKPSSKAQSSSPQKNNESSSANTNLLSYFQKKKNSMTNNNKIHKHSEEALREKESDLEKREMILMEWETKLLEREEALKLHDNESLHKVEHEYDHVVKKYEDYKEKVRVILADLLRDVSIRNRRENEEKLLRDGYNIGRVVARREGHMMVTDCWEDGEMLKEIRRKMTQLMQERDDIMAQKKQLVQNRKNANKVKKEAEANSNSNDGEFKRPMALNHSNISDEEQDEIIRIRLTNLKKDMADLKQEEDSFEQKKKQLIRFQKLIQDESNSRFSAHPALNNGRYILLEMLGKGGFSEVYKAFDLHKLRFVACKIHQLNSSWNDNRKKSYTKHATREHNIHESLRHPRIVQFFGSFAIDLNSFCTVLDFCNGCDLDMYLKIKQTLSERESCCIIRQVFNGLRYLHTQKDPIIHYDLKPGNILFHQGEVKIADFGLSKIIMKDETDGSSVGGGEILLTSQGAGTYWYLPPECFQQERPKISPKVDVWSAGIILYQMLFGHKPFGQGQAPHTLIQDNTMGNANGDAIEFPSKPAVSDNCKSFIRKCLSHSTLKRPTTEAALKLPFLKLG